MLFLLFLSYLLQTRVPLADGSYDWKDVTTEDLFANKRVAFFALPGAFTPTCSQSQVPGYHKEYDAIKAQGIDEVYCLSVNDAFVMRKWGLDLGLEEDKVNGNFKTVKFIPDGAVAFTRAAGMNCTWTQNRGFGERSWRCKSCVLCVMRCVCYACTLVCWFVCYT